MNYSKETCEQATWDPMRACEGTHSSMPKSPQSSWQRHKRPTKTPLQYAGNACIAQYAGSTIRSRVECKHVSSSDLSALKPGNCLSRKCIFQSADGRQELHSQWSCVEAFRASTQYVSHSLASLPAAVRGLRRDQRHRFISELKPFSLIGSKYSLPEVVLRT